MPSLNDTLINWAKLTPWHQFMQFTQTPKFHDPAITFLNKCTTGDQIPMDDRRLVAPGSINANYEHQKFETQAWIEDIRMSSWITLDPPIPAIYTTLSSYLPPSSEQSVEVNMGDMFDISRRSTQLECIKLAANLVSNNHDTWRVIPVIIELMRDDNNLSTLISLLKRGLVLAEAAAEKLLIPAVRDRNFPLLKALVENGVDLNLYEDEYEHKCALSCAIDNDDENMVTYLLDHGANAAKRLIFDFRHFYQSMLDVAVEHGNINIIKDILTTRPSFGSCCPAITLRTVRLAILLGDLGIINLLLDRNHSLLDKIRSKPWRFSEAAAIHKTPLTLMHLQNLGINIKASSDLGKGSALAVATYHANMPLIHQLLDLDVDVNALAIGCNEAINVLSHKSRLERRKLSMIKHKSALHIAVENGHTEIVRLLLDKGSDPNLLCGVYPLQLASSRGNVAVVKMLLEAGADVNSVPDTHDRHCRPKVSYLGTIQDESAAQLALESGHEAVFLTLIDGGAVLPNGYSEAAVRNAKWNPLQSAIIGGNLDLVRFIIENTGRNYWGTSDCLDCCIGDLGGNYAMTLIDRGIFPATALHDSLLLYDLIYEDQTDAAQRLVLETKSSLGALPSGYGAAGLAIAVRFRNGAIIRLFLDEGVKPYDLTDVDIEYRLQRGEEHGEHGYTVCDPRNGTSALQEAFLLSHNGNSQMRESHDLWSPIVLMEYCGAVLRETQRIAQHRGILFAYATAISTGRLDMVNIILDSGLDVRGIDETIGFGAPGEPRLSSLQCLFSGTHFVVSDLEKSHQLHEVAMALLKHGASPDCPAKSVFNHSEPGINTPLQYAAQLNMTSLVKSLLDMGADVNAEPNFHRGATALQLAAIHGNFEILNILLEAGANINALPAGYDGRSAIEGASEWGRLDMVIYLLEAGANVQGRANRNYRRSVYRAWETGHRCLARSIQDWKIKKFGVSDCEDIEMMMKSITRDELKFIDLDAKKTLKELYPSTFDAL